MIVSVDVIFSPYIFRCSSTTLFMETCIPETYLFKMQKATMKQYVHAHSELPFFNCI